MDYAPKPKSSTKEGAKRKRKSVRKVRDTVSEMQSVAYWSDGHSDCESVYTVRN